MSSKNKIKSGVPRPYSNKKLPLPKYLINEFIKPLSLWSFLTLLSIVIVISVGLITYYTSESYNILVLTMCGLLVLFSIILDFISDNTHNESINTPSINEVSNTIEYIRTASRLFTLSIISGIITTSFIIVSHISDIFYFIDTSTRLSIVVIMSMSFIGSYMIIKTLCEYSSMYDESILSIPIKISALPEVVTFIGFILPPVLLISTGLIYNGPPIIDVPYISLIDTVVILVTIHYIYISLVNQI